MNLESESIKNLLKSLARRRAREHNIKNYLASVERFCKFTKKTPNQLIETGNISVTLQNFVDNMLDQKLAPKTIRANYYNLQKFFSANKIEIKPKSVELPPARNVYEDRAITKEEIKVLLKTGDWRQRILVLLPSSSGIRLGSIPELKLGDLETWEKAEVSNPVALKIPSQIAKGYRGYTTFITPECYEALQDYLNYRRKFGENITSETPIIRDTFEAKGIGASKLKPLSYNGLKTVFNRIVSRDLRTEKKTRYAFKTTHGFRKFFRTCLDNAGVPAGAGASLMGHSAGLVTIYTRYTLEDLRIHYTKAVPFLTIEKAPMSEVERRKQQMREIAKFQGWDSEKLEKLEVLLKMSTTMEDLDDIPEKIERTKLEPLRRNGGSSTQKIIEESELEKHLAEGYGFVSVLPSGKIVVER